MPHLKKKIEIKRSNIQQNKLIIKKNVLCILSLSPAFRSNLTKNINLIAEQQKIAKNINKQNIQIC